MFTGFTVTMLAVKSPSSTSLAVAPASAYAAPSMTTTGSNPIKVIVGAVLPVDPPTLTVSELVVTPMYCTGVSSAKIRSNGGKVTVVDPASLPTTSIRAITPLPVGNVLEAGTLTSTRVDAEKAIDPPALSIVSTTPSEIRPVLVINHSGSKQAAVPLMNVQKAFPCKGAKGGMPDALKASLGFKISIGMGSKLSLNWKAANPGDGMSVTTTSTRAVSPTFKLTTEGLKATSSAIAPVENNIPDKNKILRERPPQATFSTNRPYKFFLATPKALLIFMLTIL